jgi:SAM-dependent methyltransferase
MNCTKHSNDFRGKDKETIMNPNARDDLDNQLVSRARAQPDNGDGSNSAGGTPPDAASSVTYIILEPYTDRERLYMQYELQRADFNEWFDRALRLGRLSADPQKANWRALDVGCGEGLFTGEIISRYPHARVVGFDKDPEAVMTANMAFGSKENVNFFSHDIINPLPNQFASRVPGLIGANVDPNMDPSGLSVGDTADKRGSKSREDTYNAGPDARGDPAGDSEHEENEGFDIAFAHVVLMHVHKPDRGLANLVAVLKPGGVLYISDPPIGSLRFPHPSLMALWDVVSQALSRIGSPDFAHRHGEYLAQAGFPEIESEQRTYVVGGASREGQRRLTNLVSGLQVTRPGLVDGLRLISGEEFDDHMRRLESELTTEMIGSVDVVNTIVRKPGP